MKHLMRTRTSPLTTIQIWSANHGIAALEFALYTPWILLLLFTAVSYGTGLRMKMEVGNAARAGAAYAASNATIDVGAIVGAAKNATTIRDLGLVVTKSPASCPDQTRGTIASLSATMPCALTGSPPGYYVTVMTSVDYTFIFTPPGMPATTKLNGKAVARVP